MQNEKAKLFPRRPKTKILIQTSKKTKNDLKSIILQTGHMGHLDKDGKKVQLLSFFKKR